MTKLIIPASDYSEEVVTASTKAFITATGAKGAVDGLIWAPLSAIREIDGFNVRVDTPDYLAHIESIKESMKANGIYRNKPVTGYIAKDGDDYFLNLTDGYTRLRAIRELVEAGVEDFTPDVLVPLIVKPASQSLEDLTVALVQDNEGRPLTVYERAIVVARLVNMNVDKDRIAERLEITPRYVDDLSVLAGAPAKVRNMVITGKVSATEAIKQLRKDGKAAADKLAAGVEAAKAAGKDKATGKDVKKAAPEPQVEIKSGVTATSKVRSGLVKTELEYIFKQGEIHPYDTIKPVRLFNDSEWWNFVDENTKADVVIEETIHIAVVITTKAPADEPEKKDDDTFADEAETPAQVTDQTGGADDTFADDEAAPAADEEI